jgi:lipoprotein-anchoring transpeptidase ErfK/SrfK
LALILPFTSAQLRFTWEATMAWTARRGNLVKGLGWLIPTLISLFAPAAQAQSTSTTQPVSRQVIVSVPDRKLVVMENGAVLREFAVAVGASVSPSPTGEFEVVSRLTDPTYYHAGVVIPAGEGNPLGPRWIGMNVKGYGIHGTNLPRSIGKAASHGCIRLRNRDIVELFSMIREGDKVEIHGERDEVIASIFGNGSGGDGGGENRVARADLATAGSAGGQ